MEFAVSLFDIAKGVWRKLRMLMPFPHRKKARWNLEENLKFIDRAIAETDLKEFERHVQKLYPRIGKYGVRLPVIEAVWYTEVPRTWYKTHLTALKRLSQSISYDDFDLHEWNIKIDNINKVLVESVEQMARQNRP